jgi:epoxyqueuosine reductase
MDDEKKELADFIKKTASEVGFDACGIAQVQHFKDDAEFLKSWLNRGFQGEMSYLERNFDKRVNPSLLVEHSKSVIVVLMNYFPEERQNESAPKIAKYAFSQTDYHVVLKAKLNELEKKIQEKFGQECFSSNQQHLFVDSAPVLERRWAEKAGLGWIGKNKMLINPDFGSFCFIGILLMNIESDYDKPIKNRCGKCRKCLDACPTNALTETDGLNANRCISYQTIEKKGEIADEIKPLLSDYQFGCDICNDVCPWNKSRAKSCHHNELKAINEIIRWNDKDWKTLSSENFNDIFRNSSLKRAGFEKLKQNMECVTSTREI